MAARFRGFIYKLEAGGVARTDQSGEFEAAMSNAAWFGATPFFTFRQRLFVGVGEQGLDFF